MRLSKTEARRLREIIGRYRLATGKVTHESSDVAAWALGRGEVAFSSEDISRYFTARFQEAARSNTIVGKHGQRVRVYHSVEVDTVRDGRPEQRTLWAHLDDVIDDDHFLLESLRQRLSGVAKGVQKVRTDLDHMNACRLARGRPAFQLTFDFIYGCSEPQQSTAG